jgi:predicted metal-dependent hydrolase
MQPPTLDQSIVVRNLSFPLNAEVPQFWLKNSRSVTMFFDHLSLVFPPGERFFIDSVRACASAVPADSSLREDMRRFFQQEALHGREHDRYNALLVARGYPVEEIDASAKALLGLASKLLTPRLQLAVTCALEHFTALLAQVLLGDDSVLEGADETMAGLWRWHAAEENEHATVAYDIFHAVGGTYAERAAVMVGATALFWGKMLEHQVRMMRSQGLASSREEWAGLGRFFFSRRSGIFFKLVGPYLQYFRRDFHPRQIDCSHLLARWREDFESMPLYRASRRSQGNARVA